MFENLALVDESLVFIITLSRSAFEINQLKDNVMLRTISLATVLVMLLAPEASSQFAWNWQGSADGWAAAGGCSVTSSEAFLTMSVTGNQPHIQSPTGLGLTADDFDSFTVSVQNHTAVGSFLLKWFDDSNALLGQATIPVETEMDGPQTYTVALSDVSGWSGSTVAKFRLRGPAGGGDALGDVDWYNLAINEVSEAVQGCTDPEACNYNPSATEEDGSCTYPGALQPTDYEWQGTKAGWTGAGGVVLTQGPDFMTMTVTGASNVAEMQSPTGLGLDAASFGSMTVTLSNPTSVSGGFQVRWYDAANSLAGNMNIPVDTGMTEFETYTLDLASSENWTGTIDKIRLRGPFALDVSQGVTDVLWHSLSMNEILNCEGECADDLDADGVCDAVDDCFLTGCTEEGACNYDSEACQDDGSCEYIGANTTVSYAWQGTKAGWIGAGGVQLTQGPDHMTMTVTGANSVAEMQSPSGLGVDASAFGHFVVEVQNPSSVVGGFQLRWYDDLGNLLGAEPIPVDSNMIEPVSYEVNLLSNSDWAGTVDKLRLRGPFDLDVSSEPSDVFWVNFSLTPVVDCDGACIEDVDDCGVCGGDGTSCLVAGCTNPFYIEFDPSATLDDGSCSNLVVLGCMYSVALNFNPIANDDDGSCEFSSAPDCAGDLDGDLAVTTGDLLAFLAVFGATCQ